MGFWIFSLIMDLWIPLVMIFFGKHFSKKAPKNINATFGYRTTRSMKNKNTWEFAHKVCGRTWFRWGLITLPLSVIPLLFVLGESTELIGTVSAIVCFIQLVPLGGVIIPTERALKKTFDQNGRRY